MCEEKGLFLVQENGGEKLSELQREFSKFFLLWNQEICEEHKEKKGEEAPANFPCCSLKWSRYPEAK